MRTYGLDSTQGGGGYGCALRRLFLYWLLFGFILSACAAPRQTVKLGPVDPGLLRDGVFQGKSRVGPVKAEVEVTVRDGVVTRIDVIRHINMMGGEATPVIPRRIISAQSTKVDVVSGATGSSVALMQAVQNALDASVTGGEKAPE